MKDVDTDVRGYVIFHNTFGGNIGRSYFKTLKEEEALFRHPW